MFFLLDLKKNLLTLTHSRKLILAKIQILIHWRKLIVNQKRGVKLIIRKV